MADLSSILCIDIGATNIKAGQFTVADDGNLILEQFAYSEYITDSEQSMTDIMLDTLTELITTNEFTAKDAYISVSGVNSYIRFVKVPAISQDPAKVREIISFEAKNAIPFPLEEVVWDYQHIEPSLEGGDESEIDAMLVILKQEDAARVIEQVEKCGFSVKALEVAPTAGYNSARANAVGTEQCEMVLNIGGRCSSLTFVDGQRFFVRTIPIAGNAITQQIAKEFNISFNDAEEMKRRHGFVALGGAYEEPSSEVAAKVSKIVRNVMTRLHAEISRSINVYRAQQGGRQPQKLYLTGGTSVLPFTPRFFLEKLKIPVEYFNPFQVITLGDSVDQNILREMAHLFSELVGLALRRVGNPPVEINLIPSEICRQNAFKSKRPWFYASVAALVCYVGLGYFIMQTQESSMEKKLSGLKDKVAAVKRTDQQVRKVFEEYQTAQGTYDKVERFMQKRHNWLLFMNTLQDLIPDDVWLTKIEISNAPLVVRKAETADEDAENGNGNGGMMSQDNMSGSGYRSSSRTRNANENASAGDALVYLNMEMYILCSNKDKPVQLESLDRISNLFTNLKKTGMFETSNQSMNTEGGDSPFANVVKTRFTGKLQFAIDSQKMTDFLMSKNSGNVLVGEETNE